MRPAACSGTGKQPREWPSWAAAASSPVGATPQCCPGPTSRASRRTSSSMTTVLARSKRPNDDAHGQPPSTQPRRNTFNLRKSVACCGASALRQRDRILSLLLNTSWPSVEYVYPCVLYRGSGVPLVSLGPTASRLIHLKYLQCRSPYVSKVEGFYQIELNFPSPRTAPRR